MRRRPAEAGQAGLQEDPQDFEERALRHARLVEGMFQVYIKYVIDVCSISTR